VLNGIDHRKFSRDSSQRAAVRRELGLQDDEIAIGGIGRLEPQKRFDLLMRAVQQLRLMRPNLRLLIVGDGSVRAMLEQTIRDCDLAAVCRLVGHRQDVPAIHNALDLFVQSSDYEGTPNAVLEAMALETPVVATDVGGTAELVTNGVHGLIVPPGDADALAGAIAGALQDGPATRARAAAARKRVEGELSFERRRQRVEAVYDELIASLAQPREAIVGNHECT
jgi:glycosyltransferase involved in cell wall biosynthesis